MTIAAEIVQRQDKDGMLRRALERIIQLYTDKSHFVYELLQNAEDAGATMIRFIQHQDCLEVLHNGHPFTLNNLQGLCDIGKSDKINDLNQIGEFGVGFKSVFGICENVMLYSHPNTEELNLGYPHFAVKIVDFVHPVDIDDDEIEEGFTTKFIFPYSVGYSFSGFDSVERLNEAVSKRLQNLGITTLLFMKNLQIIEYEIKLPHLTRNGTYVLDKKVINDHCSMVSAIGGNQTGKKEKTSYLIFSREISGIQLGRTIDIAFSLSVAEDGTYIFKESLYPYISVYFPTETESKLSFIVQGPYRTTPNRSSVPFDDKDNIALAEQTAELLKDSLIELRNNGQLNYSLLRLLPFNRDVFYSAPLFGQMFDKVKEMMIQEPLLLCKNGTYATASHVKIARGGGGMAEIFSDDLLTELLDKGINYYWLPTFLTETSSEYKKLYEFLTSELRIEVIRPESFRNAFNENQNFLYNRDDAWLVKMYKMYNNIGAAFSKHRSGANMLTAKFIKTAAGQFVAPYQKKDGKNYKIDYLDDSYENANYLPNVFLPVKNMSEMEGIDFVDPVIFEQCKSFFTEIIGLKKPNEYEFFIRKFKRVYANPKSIQEENHILDIKKLIRYKSNLEYRDEVNDLIKKYLVLKCTKKGKVLYVNPFKERIYFSLNPLGASIEMYFKNVEDYAYIDLEFYKRNNISSEELKSLGVFDDIVVGDTLTRGEYHSGNPGRQPEWRTEGDFRWKLSLPWLQEVLVYISSHPDLPDAMAKSNYIFKFIKSNEYRLKGKVYIGGNTPDIPNAYSDIISCLNKPKGRYPYTPQWNGKWLYNKEYKLVSPKQITKNELNTELYGLLSEETHLFEMLGFKKTDYDKIKEAEKEYDHLSKERKRQFFEIELRRRYGKSIADLENVLKNNKTMKNNRSFQDESYSFPSAAVKNWLFLRKHVAEVLFYANPVVYESRVRSVRVSRPEMEARSYLKNMYQIDGIKEYACQMCHDFFKNVEICQLEKKPEIELDQMNLCLCPNCASKYKKIRNDKQELDKFIQSIQNLSENEIVTSDPVEVQLKSNKLWFTQTHIAEIKELMKLRLVADNDQQDNATKSNKEPEYQQISNDGNKIKQEKEKIIEKNVRSKYQKYIGKKVYHTTEMNYGIIKAFDGEYIEIEFENNPVAKRRKFLFDISFGRGILVMVDK